MSKVLAITACPTGVAHTYMAAENLEKAGKKLGVDIKVETHGSVGIETSLQVKKFKKQRDLLLQPTPILIKVGLRVSESLRFR